VADGWAQALNATQANPAIASNALSILWDSSSINECPTAVSFDGMQSIQFDDCTFQATAGTTALAINNGAIANLDANSAISGAFTNQISLQGGAVSRTLPTYRPIAASQCPAQAQR
jgi:hypothetical protein